MTAPSMHDLYDALACGDAGCECRRALRNGHFLTHCPAHADHNPSLRVTNDNGKILLKCFAECPQDAVLQALRIRKLWPESGEKQTQLKVSKEPTAIYDYGSFQVCRFGEGPGKTFKQRRSDGAGGWIWNLKGITPHLYRQDRLRAAEKGTTVFINEGEKGVHACEERGLVATCSPMGAGKWHKEYSQDLRDMHAVIIVDNDAPGQLHAEQVADSLLDVAASVKLVCFSTLPAKADVVDYFAAGGTVEQLLRLVEATEYYAKRPKIDVTRQELTEITPQIWMALHKINEPPYLFRHGSTVTRVEQIDDEGVSLKHLGLDGLIYEVAKAASFTQQSKQGIRAVYPPERAIRNMLVQPDVPLPPLTRVVEVPVFAANGVLQTNAGYHPHSRTYFAPPPGLVIPVIKERPSASDIERAVSLLRDDLLVDFLFASEADYAHVVGLFLLPFVRDLINGPTPLHAVEASTPGTGKGLLTETILYPTTGQHIGIVPEPTDDEEFRKKLTARLIEGRQAIVIDNINRPLMSGLLCAALTADYWEDRVLGKSENIRIPLRMTWIATGNNMAYSTEVARRTVRIRLDAVRERPWERQPEEFKHPQLRVWVHEHRSELVAAGLTLGQAWIAANGLSNYQNSNGNRRTLGSFESWSSVIGGILDVAGIPGFLSNINEFYETADTEGQAWREFVSIWSEQHGSNIVTVQAILELAKGVTGLNLGKGDDRAQATSLGKQLQRIRDRIVGDYRLTNVGTRNRAALWQLVPLSAGNATLFEQAPAEALVI